MSQFAPWDADLCYLPGDSVSVYWSPTERAFALLYEDGDTMERFFSINLYTIDETGKVVEVVDREVAEMKEIVVTDIRASSTLAQTGRYGYAVKNLIDGRRGTAWCEGAKGDGVGEWIEMKLEVKKPDRRCGMNLLEVNPCYGSSKKACKNNGAVLELGIGRCGSKKPDATIDLEEFAEYRVTPFFCPRSLHELYEGPLPDGDTDWLCHQPFESTCVRFTITKVKPRAKFSDTCMSALRPSNLQCDLAY